MMISSIIIDLVGMVTNSMQFRHAEFCNSVSLYQNCLSLFGIYNLNLIEANISFKLPKYLR